MLSQITSDNYIFVHIILFCKQESITFVESRFNFVNENNDEMPR